MPLKRHSTKPCSERLFDLTTFAAPSSYRARNSNCKCCDHHQYEYSEENRFSKNPLAFYQQWQLDARENRPQLPVESCRCPWTAEVSSSILERYPKTRKNPVTHRISCGSLALVQGKMRASGEVVKPLQRQKKPGLGKPQPGSKAKRRRFTNLDDVSVKCAGSLRPSPTFYPHREPEIGFAKVFIIQRKVECTGFAELSFAICPATKCRRGSANAAEPE